MSAADTSRSVPALQLRDLTVTRGRRQVLRLDAFEVQPGEVVAILGPNGAGKSTLLLSAALLLPVNGEVRLFGERAGRRNAVRLRRQTSTVFQDSALLDVSARRNVEQALAIHGVPRSERGVRAQTWLERLGVSARATARPHQLSGGEAQRVSLARALAVQPRLLFLDEPFSGLDYATRSRLVGEMRAILAETGVTAILTTHDHTEAALLADRVVVLIDGRAVQEGQTADVLDRPATVEVARFLGYAVLPAETVRDVMAADGDLVAVPPSAVKLAPLGASRALQGSILRLEGGSGAARVVIEVGEGLDGSVPGHPLAAQATLAELQSGSWEPGTPVSVFIDESQTVWL